MLGAKGYLRLSVKELGPLLFIPEVLLASGIQLSGQHMLPGIGSKVHSKSH